jgi:hypothetical protein
MFLFDSLFAWLNKPATNGFVFITLLAITVQFIIVVSQINNAANQIKVVRESVHALWRWLDGMRSPQVDDRG